MSDQAQRFRKKSVEIEAMLYDGEPQQCQRIHDWMGYEHDAGIGDCAGGIAIETLEGQMTASVGDYIIRGVKGEFYPCKPDIFAATYEAADGIGRDAPLIFVDLIENKPFTPEEWTALHVDDSRIAYQKYLDRFQPWRIVVKSGDNERVLFRSSERYFNHADAIHDGELAFGKDSNVYLREHEKGDVELRLADER